MPSDGGKSLARLGDEYLRREDPARAAQYYEAAERSGNPHVLPKLLAACVSSRQYALAIEHAEAALARDPGNTSLRVLLGSLYGETGDEARAREHLETAAAEGRGDARVQFTVAVFFRDQARDPGRADTYFRSYLALEPAGAHATEARASLMKTVQ